MKKTLVVMLAFVLVLVVAGTSLAAESIKMGKAEGATNGTKSFTVAVVALQGETIIGAYIDEYEMFSRSDTIGVPNSDSDFGKAFANPDMHLASKKTNDAWYSGIMTKYAGATVTIANNFKAIESFVIGKTVAELEAIVSGSEKSALVDMVTGATLADTKGYLSALLAAAQNALKN